VLLIGYLFQVTGAEKLDIEYAEYAEDEDEKEDQKYRLASTAIITYIHNLSE
jgi:hypothetical protein